MQKWIAWLTAAAITFAGYALPVSAAERGKILLNETFEDTVTNAAPDYLSIEGEDGVRAVELSDTNKALYLPARSQGSKVTAEFSDTADQFAVSADMMFDGAPVMVSLTLIDTGGAEQTLLTYKGSYDEEGRFEGGLFTHEEKPVGGISVGRFTTVTVACDRANSRYAVYINGREAASGIKFKAGIGEIKGVKLAAIPMEEKSGLYVDNLRANSGDTLRTDFPKKAFNADVIAYQEPEDNGAVTYYLLDDYEKGSLSMGMAKKSNEFGFQTEENGNKYLVMTKNSTDDMHMDYSGSITSRYLVLEMDLTLPKKGARLEVYFRDPSSVLSYIYLVNSDNKVMFYPNGAELGTLASGRWLHLASRFDLVQKTVDVYVDGNLAYENVPMQNRDRFSGEISLMRCHLASAGGNGSFGFDNLRMYNSKTVLDELPDLDPTTRGSIFPDSTEGINLLRGKLAIQTSSGTLYKNNEKSKLTGPVEYDLSGNILISARALGDALGLDVGWQEEGQKILLGDNISIPVGSDKMQVGGKEVQADCAAALSGDYGMVPMRSVLEDGLGKKMFYNMHGLAIISDSTVRMTDTQAVVANGYLTYDRPSAEQIQADLTKKAAGHPRVMATKADFDRIRRQWKENENAVVKGWVDDIIRLADGTLSTEPAQHKLEGFRLLQQSRRALVNLQNLGFAYQMTGDQKYVDRAWVELSAVCSFPDWNTQHFLDVGEMSAAVAMGYDWIYDAWSAEQRKVMEDALVEMALTPALNEYTGVGGSSTVWANATMNWNIVCSGGVGLGALAIADVRPDICYQVLSYGVRGTEYYFDTFAPDGGYDEGPNYWDYALKYTTMYLSALESALGTDYNLSCAKGMEKTGSYIITVDSPEGSNGYHDGGSGNLVLPWAFWLGKRFNDPGLTQAMRSRYQQFGNASGYWVFNVLFYDSSVPDGAINMPPDSYFAGTELVNFHSDWNDPQEMFGSFHGGRLKVNHYHVDSGSFVYYGLGEKWALDLGSDDLTYNVSQYINNRELVYRVRAEGHNCVVINPDQTGGMVDSTCKVEKIESKDKGGFAVLNLTDAYAGAEEYKRGYKMDNNRRSFTVRDEIRLVSPNSEIYWFMHMPAGVEIEYTDYGAMLTQNGKRMKLEFTANVPGYELGDMQAVPLATSPVAEGQADNSNYKKLYAKMKATGNVTIQMRLTPADEPVGNTVMEDIPMADWSIPDGTLEEMPQLTEIAVGGVPLADFNPKQKDYTQKLNEGDTAPEVTAKAQEGLTVERTAQDDVTKFKVYNPASPERYSYYTVTFQTIPLLRTGPLQDVKGYHRYEPLRATASAVPEPLNVEANVTDEKLDTRWAAEGDQWIQLDYGKSVCISAVCLAWMNSGSRIYRFSLQVSNDGVDFKTVYTGKSSMIADDYEIVEIEGGTSGRYLRYVGSGNSDNQWNSVTEFGALTKGEK